PCPRGVQGQGSDGWAWGSGMLKGGQRANDPDQIPSPREAGRGLGGLGGGVRQGGHSIDAPTFAARPASVVTQVVVWTVARAERLRAEAYARARDQRGGR